MQPIATGETFVSNPNHDPATLTVVVAAGCLIWYLIVALVCVIGHVQLCRYYTSPPKIGVTNGDQDKPSVTIIRPVKGLEPSMYDCLASTFRQIYPGGKLHIRLCVSDRHDAAMPVLERLLRNYPNLDAEILIEDDRILEQYKLGPNPKIRNMSQAYRDAPSDIVWIIDCNVWVGKHTLQHLVSHLEGVNGAQKNKFVHQLPLVVDTLGTTKREETQGLSQSAPTGAIDGTRVHDDQRTLWNIGGGRLEEQFMSSAHAKFYNAINTVAVAPCALGKSTMFRRSHLNSLTDGRGIDHFSYNICEDQLIGDMLWKQQVPEEKQGIVLGKHALCFGDIAIQPMSNMSVSEYWNRRVRWLRVRKFTVTLATLVEPGTESFVCSLYGAFAITTLPFFQTHLGIPHTWLAFAMVWLLSVLIWCAMDWKIYQILHSGACIHVDEHTPTFARPRSPDQQRRFHAWLLAWLGREALAFPIWMWAFWGGTTVEWRGKHFWVDMNMKVHEITDRGKPNGMNGTTHRTNGKLRSD